MIALTPALLTLFEGNTHARLKVISPGVWAIRPTTRANTPQGEYRLTLNDGMLVGHHPMPAGITKLKEIKGWLHTGEDGEPVMVGESEGGPVVAEPVKRGRPPVVTEPPKPRNHNPMVYKSPEMMSTAAKIIAERQNQPRYTMADVDPNWRGAYGMPAFLKVISPEQYAAYKSGEKELPKYEDDEY